ncbi:MAG TPA: hypothetical protein VGE72_25070 [Azospirillum sp.]
MKPAAKPHPRDAWEAAQIARATRFTAHIRVSPFEKHTVPCATLDEARAAAARLTAEHGAYGRRACVYAITPEGLSIHVA